MSNAILDPSKLTILLGSYGVGKGQVMADTVPNGRPRKLGQPGFSGSAPRAKVNRNGRHWNYTW